jgi:hypothetical protein
MIQIFQPPSSPTHPAKQQGFGMLNDVGFQGARVEDCGVVLSQISLNSNVGGNNLAIALKLYK